MSASRGDHPVPDTPVDGIRTVLVYMAAGNSINPLACFTDGDLEELKAGMASIDNTSDMHLLVYICLLYTSSWTPAPDTDPAACRFRFGCHHLQRRIYCDEQSRDVYKRQV